MSILKTAVCGKLTDEADAILDMLDSARSVILDQLNNLRSFLSSMSISPEDMIDSACQTILDNMASMIPSLDMFDELAELINTCLFLKEDESLSQPSTLARTVSDKCKDYATEQIDGYTSGLPEFDGANLYDTVYNSLQGNGINTSVQSVTKALNCMSGMCGIDVTSRATRLNSFINSCDLDGEGNLSLDKVITSSGITNPTKIANLQKSTASVTNVYSNVSSSVSAGVEMLKQVWF